MCRKHNVMIFQKYVFNVTSGQNNIFSATLRNKTRLFETPNNKFSSVSNNAFTKKQKTLLISAIAVSSAAALSYAYFSPKKVPVIIEEEVVKKVKFVEPNLDEKIRLLNDFGKIPYIIVGAGTAASAAFKSIRAHDPYSKILIIGEESHYPYMKPPLSKELWFSSPEVIEKLAFKQWSGRERSAYFEPDVFYCPIKDLIDRKNGGVSILRGLKVVRIDPDEKIIYLDNGQTLSYEKCLLVPGGKPKNLSVFANAANNVKKYISFYKTADDFKNLYEVVRNVKSISIVGGGFLGSELACALGKISKVTGLEVLQIFPESGVLGKILPEYLSQYASEKVHQEGATVIPNSTIKSVSEANEKIKLTLDSGKDFYVDHVVVAVGFEPNTELAKSAGLETDPINGGFLANSEMEVRKDLWVAGDAVSFFDEKLGRRRIEHHDHALISGHLAGANMAGKVKPLQNQSFFWSDLGPDVGFEAVGILDSSLETFGIFSQDPENHLNETSSPPSTDREKQDQTVLNQSQLNAISSPQKDNYARGIIFYLKNQTIVGILLWNVFGQMPIAKKIINEVISTDDLVNVGKLFSFKYSEEESKED